MTRVGGVAADRARGGDLSRRDAVQGNALQAQGRQVPQGCDLGAGERSAPQSREERRQTAARAPCVEPAAQTHHPDAQVVLTARLLDDPGHLTGVGLVAACHDHAQVKPPPRAPDALDRALQVLLGHDAIGAGLGRAEGAICHEAPLAAPERLPGVALEQRGRRREQQLDDAGRREGVHDGHEAFDRGSARSPWSSRAPTPTASPS